MTLRELIAANPSVFYAQSWYSGEPFMDIEALPIPAPSRAVSGAPEGRRLLPAADLALAYIRDPSNEVWQRYLWTADLDRFGQRVYVGSNGHGFEIHRHIHLTERFGVPVW